MKKRKKKNFFGIVLVSNIVIFTTILLLSIPVLFKYENLENIIENKFYKEFNIDLTIQDKISYKVLPKPHLLIKAATLNLDKNDQNFSVVETKNLKIFIPIDKIFSKSKIEIEKIEISETNFNLKTKDLRAFRNHMFDKINKPIKIKKSKFFYLDENNNVILISPIYNLNYFINIENKVKKLNIEGNIFDTEYKSEWKKFYENPNKTYNDIKFKNPNINIKNNFNKKNKSSFSGDSLISFLNDNIFFKYEFEKDKIIINSPTNVENQKVKIFSKVNLNPFYFNAKIILIEKNYKFLIDYLLNHLVNANKNILENLNGELTFFFNDLGNEIVESGKIDLIIKEQSIEIIRSNFNIKDIGNINSTFKYIEREGELIFSSRNELKVEDYREFARKFQIDFDKAKKVKKIFFDLEKTINKNEFIISNIHINNINKNQKKDKLYNITSLQMLKSVLRSLLV